jgi:hypothetical protein
MTRSFTVSVGTTPTPLVAPDWSNNPAVAVASTVTAGSTLTLANLGTVIAYNSASAGTFTIDSGLTPDIGVSVWIGQLGAGAVTIAAGSGVTLVGTPVTYGPNHLLQVTQTALNTWTITTYSWNLPQFLNKPAGLPLLVAYGRISFINNSSSAISIDTNPNVTVGSGTLVPANTTVNKDYGNGPADLWYGIAAAATPLSVWTGPLSYS